MAHSASSSSALSSRGSSSTSSTGFKVYGSLFKVSSRYQFLNPLGKGSYGVVCAAKDRDTGQCVAIKKVTPMAKRTTDAKHTLREVLLLQHLGKHPNVISVHNLSANIKDDELYIVMDLMDTDMHRVIQSSQPLSDAHAKYFLHQLLRGVQYLHENGVLHRDLKPGNLLLSKTCQLKIADFGLARKIPRGFNAATTTLERPRSAPAASSKAKVPDRAPMTEHVVTRWYRAPELMLQPDGLYDQSVDMWSVGCIFAEILGRKALFPGKNFLHQLTLIFDVIGAPSSEDTMQIQSSQAQRFLKSISKKPKIPFRTLFPKASEAAVDLLDRLLEFDPTTRISAQEALAHPYMQDIERKYRNRGGSDPPPCMRADFSFDLKKLSKLDLRALIVKEVDNHRKSTLTRTNSTGSFITDSGENKEREVQPAVEKPRAVLTPSVIPSVTSSTSSSSSSARISKIHATLRQAQQQSQGQELQPANVVTFGSNRQRIRTTSKPPVPKQQDVDTCGSNQQEHVRVIPAQATFLSDSLASKGSPPEQVESKAATTGSIKDVPTHKAYAHTSLSARVAHTSKPSPLATLVYTGGSAVDSSGSDALATCMALNRRSKALIATLTLSSGVSAPIQHTQAWQAKQRRNPEHSASSSSSSAASSPPRHDSSVCTAISRSNRPGSAFLTKVIKKKPEGTVAACIALRRPRRVSSAGPTRSKPRVLPGNGSRTARNVNSTNTYVGSINSLIRAQRSNNGQSLADSADNMLANMTPSKQQEPFDSRDENESTVSGTRLKTQRSTSKLPGVDLLEKKGSARKLTVPKSPKFSVMSWQKKGEGRTGYASSMIR
ncbi:Protein kinase domain [Phytophthora infestans]|uniref:Protein kinase domain n=1 Tax=Phytophthora infestans TaxID=4787 RepID=A0A833SQN2_PHYIN|nr:Protein kinase domain [Phytophthora infestans]KAF4144631.1 Protein kinase domain [Phytophthora infestans]